MGAPFRFNPTTGQFDYVADPNLAPFTYQASCLASDAVNNCVKISGDRVGGLPQVRSVDITDRTKMPATGIIISKSNSTTCTVASLGVVTTGQALTPGKLSFVGADSKPTETRPSAPANIQVIGFAFDTATLMLQPQLTMTRVNL